jgi:hypothetical protein
MVQLISYPIIDITALHVLPTDTLTLVQESGDSLTHFEGILGDRALDVVRPCIARMRPLLSRQSIEIA